MKKISILIAAFKAERWLEQCVDSVRLQELPAGWELEIVIGIDGCAPTLEIAKQIANHDLKIISLKENYGTYVTFNTLMKYATGSMICRFDADDAMLPGYLMEQLLYLQEDAFMTMTWGITTDGNLRPLQPECGKNGGAAAILNNRNLAEGNFIMRRKVWNELGGFQPWRCGADTDFGERIKQTCLLVKVVEKPLYYRRMHPNSLTAHVATNFDSELRGKIRIMVAAYAKEYRDLRRPLKIEPVYAEVDGFYDCCH